MNIENTDECKNCGALDVLNHTIMVCDRWTQHRRIVNINMGEELCMYGKNGKNGGQIQDRVEHAPLYRQSGPPMAS